MMCCVCGAGFISRHYLRSPCRILCFGFCWGLPAFIWCIIIITIHIRVRFILVCAYTEQEAFTADVYRVFDGIILYHFFFHLSISFIFSFLVEVLAVKIKRLYNSFFNLLLGCPPWKEAFKSLHRYLESFLLITLLFGHYSEYGIHIIRYAADAPSGAVELESVREVLTGEALQEKKNELFRTQVESWVKEADVKVYKNRLSD